MIERHFIRLLSPVYNWVASSDTDKVAGLPANYLGCATCDDILTLAARVLRKANPKLSGFGILDQRCFGWRKTCDKRAAHYFTLLSSRTSRAKDINSHIKSNNAVFLSKRNWIQQSAKTVVK